MSIRRHHAMSERSQAILLVIILAGLLLLFAFSITLDGESRAFWLQESGVVESLSAAAYFICAFFMFYWGGIRYIKQYHYYFLLVIFFGMRELDFHKKFTTMSLLKSRLYTSGDVPLIEKIIGFMLVVLLLYIAITIVKKNYKNLVSGVKALSLIHINALLVLVFLVLSKSMDGISRKLRPFGIEVEKGLAIHLTSLEEILELGVPILILFMIHQYFSGRAEEGPA